MTRHEKSPIAVNRGEHVCENFGSVSLRSSTTSVISVISHKLSYWSQDSVVDLELEHLTPMASEVLTRSPFNPNRFRIETSDTYLSHPKEMSKTFQKICKPSKCERFFRSLMSRDLQEKRLRVRRFITRKQRATKLLSSGRIVKQSHLTPTIASTV